MALICMVHDEASYGVILRIFLIFSQLTRYVCIKCILPVARKGHLNEFSPCLALVFLEAFSKGLMLEEYELPLTKMSTRAKLVPVDITQPSCRSCRTICTLSLPPKNVRYRAKLIGEQRTLNSHSHEETDMTVALHISRIIISKISASGGLIEVSPAGFYP